MKHAFRVLVAAAATVAVAIATARAHSGGAPQCSAPENTRTMCPRASTTRAPRLTVVAQAAGDTRFTVAVASSEPLRGLLMFAVPDAIAANVLSQGEPLSTQAVTRLGTWQAANGGDFKSVNVCGGANSAVTHRQVITSLNANTPIATFFATAVGSSLTTIVVFGLITRSTGARITCRVTNGSVKLSTSSSSPLPLPFPPTIAMQPVPAPVRTRPPPPSPLPSVPSPPSTGGGGVGCSVITSTTAATTVTKVPLLPPAMGQALVTVNISKLPEESFLLDSDSKIEFGVPIASFFICQFPFFAGTEFVSVPNACFGSVDLFISGVGANAVGKVVARAITDSLTDTSNWKLLAEGRDRVLSLSLRLRGGGEISLLVEGGMEARLPAIPTTSTAYNVVVVSVAGGSSIQVCTNTDINAEFLTDSGTFPPLLLSLPPPQPLPPPRTPQPTISRFVPMPPDSPSAPSPGGIDPFNDDLANAPTLFE